MSDEFNEARFRRNVDQAILKVKTVLDNERNPEYPADVPHMYEDKFFLAEAVTNVALGAELNCLEALGVDEKKLKQFLNWAKTRSVTLRLKAEHRCVISFDTRHLPLYYCEK